MSAMISKKEPAEERTTNVGRFLAKRGILLVKEFREIGVIKGDYGDRIVISTLILSSAKSTKGEVQFGIRVEHYSTEGTIRGSGFLDYEEIAELIGALDFVENLAARMSDQTRDYTEVNYLTKDNLKFGFFQSDLQQQAFIGINAYDDSLFLDVEDLKNLNSTIEMAKQHLVSRGAGSENSTRDSAINL